MQWGRAIELSEDARFTLFRPSEFKADLYLVHLSLQGFTQNQYFNVAEKLESYIKDGGLRDMEAKERKSFDFFYGSLLGKLKDMS